MEPMETEPNWVEAALAQMERFIPATGFNVVGVDAFEKPGEALYFVAHTEDAAEAEKLALAHTKQSGNKTHIYPAD